MDRLAILRRIDALQISNCETCQDRPGSSGYDKDYTIKSNHCMVVCPVGLELQDLGKKLADEVMMRRKKKYGGVGEEVTEKPTEKTKKQRKLKYPHITEEFLRSEFAKGKTNQQIAEEQGIPQGTLAHRLKSFNLINPNKGRPGRIRKMEKQANEKVKAEEQPAAVMKSEEKPEYKVEHDPVNRPSHYVQGGIEAIDIMRAKMPPDQFRGYLLGNVYKYLMRHEHKNGVEDLRKAEWYLKRLISQEEAQ